MTCTSCGAALDPATTKCACGAEIALGRLSHILGLVCRACDAYNDPGAKVCVGCGKPLVAMRAANGKAGPIAITTAAAAANPNPPPTAAATANANLPPTPTSSPTPRTAGARLVVERGEAAPGTVFRLGADELPAGRVQGILAFPDDPCLAPLHATFALRGGGVVVRDEGAAGGVYVRLRATALPMRGGMLFAVGDRLLRFGGVLSPPPAGAADGTRRLGAPRPDRPAVALEEWLEGGVGGRAWVRQGPSVTIGRAGCAISLGEDAWLSQAHAEIALDASGEAQLRDLGSAHGTFVRIPPGSEHELRDGDAVRLGREVLRVEVG